MKLKRAVFCSILVCFALNLGGCGDKMYTLTEEEAEIIALYSAKMVSKFNKDQKTGINNAIISDEELGITAAEEDDIISSDPLVDGDTEVSADNEDSEATPVATGGRLSNMAVDGIDFVLDDYEVTNEYKASDVFVLNAAKGSSYVVLNLLATNNTDDDIDVDVLDSGNVYRLTVNGKATVTAQTTILMNDLSTYQGTINAGETKELILVFEFKKDQIDSVEKLSVGVSTKQKTDSGSDIE